MAKSVIFGILKQPANTSIKVVLVHHNTSVNSAIQMAFALSGRAV